MRGLCETSQLCLPLFTSVCSFVFLVNIEGLGTPEISFYFMDLTKRLPFAGNLWYD